ncbi:hypothetical protein LTR48_000771 [Friedmanniomyces endolithicus]|uniref:Uncharacterized protein n=2 Tax=Dothideomycetidae TaxID=451867 RepID=A0A4U0VG21_9PEZI|nr:hypothetical protein LTS09_014249 [Friedmanniomyces endolithicus]KAK1094227.1 hypothetical protein LTR48_000771 [Friedmanniomyces endolithicus]KAK5147657.1 hypothetical protein LTR32_000937 [Rachicladosporium monterosium]TKA47994.1 hypothetical protein B0A54_01485 [Friedmanniomyces endolithicus]
MSRMLTRRQVPGIIPATGKKHRHYDGKANEPFVDDYLVPAERTKRTGRTTAKLDEKVQGIARGRTFYGT